jgi:carbon storage regulator CsrA
MMRVFLRGVNESLIIDHEMEVRVLEIQADHVRLGISTWGEFPDYWEETVYLTQGVDSDLELVESSRP